MLWWIGALGHNRPLKKPQPGEFMKGHITLNQVKPTAEQHQAGKA
jgi:hypothetical protein